MRPSPSYTSAPLELTLIQYNPSDVISHILAILTLSPMLVIPAYLAVFVWERELSVLLMLAGQLANEALSWLMKRWLKAERPYANTGSGYASPSSHSQFFGYFLVYLAIHLCLVQSSPARWTAAQQTIWRWKRAAVLVGVSVWSLAVAFSRWYLSYHTPSQITLGLFLGALVAIIYALLVEVLPRRQPERLFGRTRRWLVKDVLGRWWGLRELEVGDRWDGRRDGWEMEGGRAELWRVVSKTTTGGAAPTTIRKGD